MVADETGSRLQGRKGAAKMLVEPVDPRSDRDSALERAARVRMYAQQVGAGQPIHFLSRFDRAPRPEGLKPITDSRKRDAPGNALDAEEKPKKKKTRRVSPQRARILRLQAFVARH